MTLSIECQNFLRSLQLLNLCIKIGVKNILLSPGSRSAPLAIAAGELNKRGLINLYNSIDERSSGFHALGISTASGDVSLVITTSGTAVANLLPAAVEADKSCKSIIFITADRPLRLKNCGSNQTVNQEDFLISVCRQSLSTSLNGLHQTEEEEILEIFKIIKKQISNSPGPIHLNIPLEKPLDISYENKKEIFEFFAKFYLNKSYQFHNDKNQIENINCSDKALNNLNLSKPGVIIVGPYQGSIKDLLTFNNSLKKIQEITGWPILADPASCISSQLNGLVENWELIIEENKNIIQCDQLLRLGPMSSSQILENFLLNFNGLQFLVKEKNNRKLDPLKKAFEYDFGLENFVNKILIDKSNYQLKKRPQIKLTKDLIKEGKRIKEILKNQLTFDDKLTEFKLANFVPKIWPENYPIMLSASSPIRDWLRFSENRTLTRKCFSFRGASGIDGTLSLALGIARISNPLLLVTGDLAFIHDINGWLIEKSTNLNLTILLINNNGGNIFNNLYKNNLKDEELKKLFLMPKSIKWENIALTYDVKYKDVTSFCKLKDAIEWSLSVQKSVIIKVDIDVDHEINERISISKKI